MLIEKDYIKNRISCSLAASEGYITIGFTGSMTLVPKTLLKGNQLHNPEEVDFVLRKKRNEKKFNEIIYGDESCLIPVLSMIGQEVSEELKKEVWNRGVHQSEF